MATVGLPSSGLAVDQQTPHEGCVGCMTLLVCSSSDPLVVVGVVGEVGEEHGPGQLHLLCGPGGSNHLKRGQAFYKKWLGEELPFFNEGYKKVKKAYFINYASLVVFVKLSDSRRY